MHLARIEAEANTQSRPHRRAVRSVAQVRSGPHSGSLWQPPLWHPLIGCGNTYRPVVSAINPVGPAGQPQKFAVAISTTGTAPPHPWPGHLRRLLRRHRSHHRTDRRQPLLPLLNSGGNTGYTLNSDHTLTTFDISTSLLQSQILQTTLLSQCQPGQHLS